LHHRYVVALFIVISLATTNGATFARAGSTAPPLLPAGRWDPLPGFDCIHLDEIHELCWHQGDLYASGFSTHNSLGPDLPSMGIFVWRDDQWQLALELEKYSYWHLASDGEDLVAVQAGIVHRLDDGQWRRDDIPLLGPVEAVALWRGEVVMGGQYLVGHDQVPARLVVFDGKQVRPLGGDVGGVPRPRVTALLPTEAGLWVAGRFETAGRRSVGNVARFDGLFWHDLDGGVDGEVTALAHDAGGVSVSGAFALAGKQACDGLAAWRGERWQALPPIPPHWMELPLGQACPEAKVRGLASHRDGLVAIGRFSFADAAGETVQNVTQLIEQQWRQMPGAGHLATPDRRQPYPRVRRIDSIEPLATYEPRWRERHEPWWPGLLAASDGRVAIGDQRFMAIMDDTLTVHASVYRMSNLRLDLTAWRGDLLLLGPEMLHGHRLAGLGRLGTDGWQPLGNWLGTNLSNGGSVEATAIWRSELVVAGGFHFAADQVVRHVAAFDGQRWRPLGEGIPRASLRNPVLVPRSKDLILIGACGPGGMTAWQWNDEVWRELKPPPTASRDFMDWQIVAAGDSVWATVRQIQPHKYPKRVLTGEVALYSLVDTVWTELGLWEGWTPTALAHRDGAVYALGPQNGNEFKVLACWDGSGWREVAPFNLPSHLPDQSTGAARLQADGSVFLPGEELSYYWDGEGWARWPGTNLAHQSWRGRIIDGRLYTLGGPMRVAVWNGPLPGPEPGLEPPHLAPVAQPRRWKSTRRDDLPPLLAGAPTDSLMGWTMTDRGGSYPEPEVEVRNDDQWRLGPHTSLTFRFRTPRPTWARLTCEVSDVSEKGGNSLGLYVETPLPGMSERVGGMLRGSRCDHVKNRGPHELMAPAVAADIEGWVTMTSGKGRLHLDNLNFEFGDHFLVEAMETFRTQLQQTWRPPVTGGAVPGVLPSRLVAAAGRTFNAAGADSLALSLACHLNDDRIYVRKGTVWGSGEHEEPIEQVIGDDPLMQIIYSSHRNRPRLYSFPADHESCELLPDGVDFWLPDDIAYCNIRGPNSFTGEQVQLPDPSRLLANGLVVDLREPDTNHNSHGHRMQTLMFWYTDGGRWARVCDGGGQCHDWWTLDDHYRPRKIPLVLLIGPHTSGTHALLAEALIRLADAMAIGETTAPLPAWNEPVDVPWDYWSLMIPAGTWEAPDGTTLTDLVVEPDIIWPADDTEGLLEQVRRLVEDARAVESP